MLFKMIIVFEGVIKVSFIRKTINSTYIFSMHFMVII